MNSKYDCKLPLLFFSSYNHLASCLKVITRSSSFIIHDLQFTRLQRTSPDYNNIPGSGSRLTRLACEDANMEKKYQPVGTAMQRKVKKSITIYYF